MTRDAVCKLQLILRIDLEKKLGARRVAKLEEMVAQCDVVTVVSRIFVL